VFERDLLVARLKQESSESAAFQFYEVSLRSHREVIRVKVLIDRNGSRKQ
jgi:hypothetical protein